jgi:AAHS family benzoate transporter-like MFS transporter
MSDSLAIARPRWQRWIPFLRGAPELTARQWRVLGLVSLATLFDQYDLSIFGMALPQIQAGLGIAEADVGWLGSILRMGSLPAIFIALAADRIGRRRALLGTILAYTALTGATALATDPHTYVTLQFLARVFGTAEILLAVVVISEELAPEARGWGIGALFAIKACGVGLAAGLLPLAASSPQGWRGLYLVGLAPLLMLAWLRRSLPETERFEARAQVAERGIWLPLRRLARDYPGRFAATAAIAVVFSLGIAAADLMGPKYLQQAHGWSARQVSLLYISGGAIAICGAPIAGRLSDRFGRLRMTIFAGVAVFALFMAFFNASGVWLVPLWIALVFMLVGHDTLLSTYGAELFPTSHRSTAAGARLGLATIGGALGLALESMLYGVTGSHWSAISILLCVALLAPLLVALTYPETAGRSLEEISPEHDEPSLERTTA